jgi:hypothetical protein
MHLLFGKTSYYIIFGLYTKSLFLIGLGTKLNQVLLEHARRRGFKHVVVDATNPTIYYIYTKKLNGKVFTSIYAPTWISKDGNGDDYRPLEHFNAEITFIVFDL